MAYCTYKAKLAISATTFDKKDAERILKEPIDRLKALAKAFDFILTSDYFKDKEYGEHSILPKYIFTFGINAVLEPDFGLNFAMIVRIFANMNAFEISDIELYLFNDE